MGFAEESSADAERGAKSSAETWADRSGQDVCCDDQDSGLLQAMLEIGMGNVETSTGNDEVSMTDGQKAKGFAFKMKDRSAITGNKSTETQS